MNTFEDYKQAINERLRGMLDECREDVLREAMAYSVFAGGKRLRPLLLLSASEAAGGAYNEHALDFACSVEMIHTYSLIHDDLPAMDDDDFRRGLPTCHKVYGEATAILAGDALLSHAFEKMAWLCAETGSRHHAYAMWTLARAVGANGMVAGQMADMLWENKIADESTLLNIHARKTGALISACVEAGAELGGGGKGYVQKMARLGSLVGLAFQIRDDLLDVTATTETLGKPAGSDEKNRKSTYVTLHGLQKAQADLRKLTQEAFSLLDELPQKTNRLRVMIERTLEY